MPLRWDIVTLGNLSRNRYWGESEDRPRRSALCTCTLVRGEGFCLLVDPACGDAGKMAEELDRRSGLPLSAVTAVFLTHAHGDHHAGLAHFPQAQWLAAPAVAEALNASGRYPPRVQGAAGRIFEAVEVIPTPGHTPDHHSLRLESEGRTVVVAGDAVMTRDFWQDRRGFFNSTDPAQASRTMERLAEFADVIVPGHDNAFPIR